MGKVLDFGKKPEVKENRPIEQGALLMDFRGRKIGFKFDYIAEGGCKDCNNRDFLECAIEVLENALEADL